MTKEDAIICLKGIKNYGRDTFTEQSDFQNSLDMAIKALEQQPNDDCVSRQAVLDKAELIELEDGQTFYCISPEDIKALPPVTPTQCIAEVRFSKEELRDICKERIEIACEHGTCKDCANYVAGALDEEICIRGHELIHKDFYCRDFKKRGTENDSIT